MLNVAAIIQVRRGATRLPDKVFQLIGNKPLIEHAVLRLKKAESLDEVIVATTTNPLDDKIKDWCSDNNIPCFRGSEQDVLLRYVEAARQFKVKTIVRACGDNPFVDTELVDLLVEGHRKGSFDLTNTKGNVVLGSGVEVVEASSLEKAEGLAMKTAYREHVTTFFYDHPSDFRLNFVQAPDYLSELPLRITIDDAKDLELCRNVYNSLSKADLKPLDGFFPAREVVDFLKRNPEVAAMNKETKQKDWRKELEAEA